MTLPDPAGAASTSPWRGSKGGGGVSRPLIVAAVLIAAVWTLAAALIQAQVFWLALVLHVGPMLVALAALLASAVFGNAKSPSFVVREGVGFVVPASRGFGYLVAGQVLILGFLANQLIELWTWADTGPAGIDAYLAVLSVVCLVVAGWVALLVVTALRGGPQILLTPDALALHLWGARTIPWDALRPGRPLPQVRRRVLILTVDRPELVVRDGGFWRSTRRPWLVLQHFRVHPWFLADAIRFYVDHPDRRGGIGTRAEYERLLPELGVPVGEHAG